MATGRITGVVTTDEQQPRRLRGARVTLNGSAADTGRAVLTGDDGTFVLDDVPPGRFVVGAIKEGYMPMYYGATRTGRSGAGVQVAAGQTVPLTLRLPRGAVITGTVIDIDGQPAVGMLVGALVRRFAGSSSGDYIYMNSGVPERATTDDRGVYRIYGLAAGEYLVATQPPTRSGTAPGSIGTIVHQMSRGAVSPRAVLLTQMFHPGTADVSHATRVAVRAGEERIGVDIQLDYVGLATVRGTAIGAAGFGATLVSLWRLDEQAHTQNAPMSTADDGGRFQFTSVPPGQYRLSARVSAGDAVESAVADITVSGEDLDVPLAMQTALSMSGRVVYQTGRTNPPAPLERLTLPLNSQTGGWPIPSVVFDAGRFRITGIVPGVYRTSTGGGGQLRGGWWLTSIVAGGRELLDTPFDLRQNIDDAVLTLSDHPSSISGTVQEATGAPAFQQTVVVFPVERRFWFVDSRHIAAVRSGRDGRWGVPNLPPGDYRVVAADVDLGEWFDPEVLERLSTIATPVHLGNADRQTISLVVR
jgi:protocatechuate 3,4-dioxygenase beta subunit